MPCHSFISQIIRLIVLANQASDFFIELIKITIKNDKSDPLQKVIRRTSIQITNQPILNDRAFHITEKTFVFDFEKFIIFVETHTYWVFIIFIIAIFIKINKPIL